jgi:hypothetical protein
LGSAARRRALARSRAVPAKGTAAILNTVTQALLPVVGHGPCPSSTGKSACATHQYVALPPEMS